ncbi:MAG: methyltransferase family protein [Halodesulfurarchaeum sp.]
MARRAEELLGAGGRILLVMVPATLGLLGVGVWNGAWFPPAVRRVGAPAGAVLVLLGFAVIFRAFAVLRAAREADRLCTNGPYAHVRHPLYAAWIWLVLPGATLLVGLWTLVPAAPLMAVLTWRSLPLEEEALREAYPQQYAAYAAAVPALWPRLRPHGWD